jgi:hypothetical protein
MQIVRRLHITFLAVRYSLVPLRRTGRDGTAPDDGTAVTPQTLPLLLADLSRAMDSTGSIRLFLPGCLSAAAPCLLFRLKRSGYSACRATISPDGLLLSASR